MKKSLISFENIQKLMVLYLVVWSISPFMEIDLIYRIGALGAAAVWALLALMRKIEFDTVHFLSLYFLAAVMIINFIETGGFGNILKPINLYMLVIFFIMGGFYKDRWNELSGFIPLILILLIVFDFRSAQAVIADPTLARLIVRNDENIYQYLRQGIGGYALIYEQVCIFPALFYWTIKSYKHNKLYFALGAVWAGTYFVFIANAGYSIAIAATAVSLFILFFYKRKNVGAAVLIGLVLIFGFLALLIYWVPFREMLLEFFDGTAVAKKINDLVAGSESGETEGSIAARVDAYLASLWGIIKFPVIGYLWSKNGSAGAHSAILDYFAKYGLWGGYIYVKMLFSSAMEYKKKFIANPVMVHVTNASIVSILLVSLLDTIPYQIVAMVVMVLPILFDDIIDWEAIKSYR